MERALRALGDRLVDVAAEDPEKLIQMGENALSAAEHLGRAVRENPGAVKRAAANAVIQAVARAVKKGRENG